MIKCAQERCLLAWYVGRKKLSWLPSDAAAYRIVPLYCAVPCLVERRGHQRCTQVGHLCWPREHHVGTWHIEKLLSNTPGQQSCTANHVIKSVAFNARKFATQAYVATVSELSQPCYDRTMHMEITCHGRKHGAGSNDITGHLRCIQRNKFSTLAAAPESALGENGAFSTAMEPAAAPESTPAFEIIEGLPSPADPCNSQTNPVLNPPQTPMRPLSHVSADYAWPPLSTQQPSFINPRRFNFHDVVETVTRIISGRPWGPSVVTDLNKLDVCMNSYHVVAVLKVLSNTNVALGFFSWLKEKDGYKHNGFTYSKLFEILGNAKEIHTIQSLMKDMVNEKIDMIPNVFTTVARAYANMGMLKNAVLAFRSMEEYGCMPDSHAYDIIIDILVKGGCQEEAYAMYHKMLERGFFPNLYVCNLLVDSYWREERPDDALALFEKMKEKGEIPNMNTYNFLIKGLAKGGKGDSLWSVIKEMEDKGLKPNLTTYNTLIGVVVQAEEVDFAVKLLDHMVGAGIKPNNYTYTFLISGLGKAGKLKEVQILFKGIKELGVAPDDYVYNALVLNLSKAGKFNAAWEALQEMRSAGFKPSRSSYLALVDSFKEADKPDLVRRVFNVMQADDCAPHIVAYHNLIEKYSADRNTDKASLVFQDMKKDSSLADVGTYNLMLKIHGKAKDLKKCRQIFSDMRTAGIQPSVVTYSTMIQTLGQTGCVKDAYNLFKEMRRKGCKADAVAYGTMLKAMVNAGQVEKAMLVFEEGKKTHKDLVMYSIMIDGFGRARKFDKAMRLLKEMRARSIQPDAVIFNSLIASLFKADETEEAYDLYRNMPKYGCEPDRKTKDIVNTLSRKAMTRKRK